MRHLFIRGFYKPMGVSGNTLLNELLILQPEIYGSIGAVVAMLIWLWFSSFLVLYGAALNAQIEQRMARGARGQEEHDLPVKPRP